MLSNLWGTWDRERKISIKLHKIRDTVTKRHLNCIYTAYKYDFITDNVLILFWQNKSKTNKYKSNKIKVDQK